MSEAAAPLPAPEPVAPPTDQDVAIAMAMRLIRQCEGCTLKAYPDPGSGGAPCTIGYGTTTIDGRPVAPGETITQDEAETLLAAEVARIAAEVFAMVRLPLAAHAAAALISFAYNAGLRALRGSTLLLLVNAGDMAGAAAEFAKWVYADGRRLPGLVRRRALERAVFLGQINP